MSPSSRNECISARVRHEMERQRISGRRLAELIDMPYGTLKNYLTGSRSMPAPIMARICDELDVSADWFLCARAARLDGACVGRALDFVDEISKAAARVGHDGPLGAHRKLFESVYEREFGKLHGDDVDPAAS